MYILYLSPTAKNKFHQHCFQIFNDTGIMIEDKKLDENIAVEYPLHATLTSFFNCDNETLEKIFQTLTILTRQLPDNKIENMQKVVQPKIVGYLLKEFEISRLVQTLSQFHPEEIKPRNSNQLHISLIYGFNEKYSDNVSKYFELQDVEFDQQWEIGIWKTDRYLTDWTCVHRINL